MSYPTKYWPTDTLKKILEECKKQHLTYKDLKIYEEAVGNNQAKCTVIIPVEGDRSLCRVFNCVVNTSSALEATVELRTFINILNRNDNVVITRQQLIEMCTRISSSTSRALTETELLNLIDYNWQEIKKASHSDWVNTLETNEYYKNVVVKLCSDCYKLGHKNKEISADTQTIISQMIHVFCDMLRKLNVVQCDQLSEKPSEIVE